MSKKIQCGDVVEWTYEHALNSVSRVMRTKRGTVVSVGDEFCYVLFEGNKNKVRKLKSELKKRV